MQICVTSAYRDTNNHKVICKNFITYNQTINGYISSMGKRKEHDADSTIIFI